MSKPLSPAQLVARRKGGASRAKAFTREYQQAARQALADKVDPSYFAWIGRIGYHIKKYRELAKAGAVKQAQAYDEEIRANVDGCYTPSYVANPGHLDRAMGHYRETGTRVMMCCFEPGMGKGKLIKLSGKKRGPRRKSERRA